METLLHALSNFKSSFFGLVAAFAGYEASLNGPHAHQWAMLSALAVGGLGAVSADAGKTKILAMFAVLLLATTPMNAQTATPPPSAFSETSISFSLTPITLPGMQETLSGAETDALIHFTPNNIFGETTLISTSPFIGARYERVFPSIANFLQNRTSLTGGNFQAGITMSLGVVKADKQHWGERAGIFLKYAPSGSSNFNVGIDAEWNNLPGIARHVASIAVGPNFRF